MERFAALPEWIRGQPFPAGADSKMLKVLSHQPQTFPTGRQSIQFQFENKGYLEFEVFVDKTHCLREFTVEPLLEDAQIERIVDEFFGEE